MRILILGANGMIGHKMYQILSKKYSDTWVCLKRRIKYPSYLDLFNKSKFVEISDLEQFNELYKVLDMINPDIIVNAVGITIRRGINNSPAKSIIINSALPHYLNEWIIKDDQKKLIHFSTDCVFSGKKGAYEESDLPDAVDLYGRTKAMGEIMNSSHVITLRGSMIGFELENKTELLEWALKQKNMQIKGFDGVIYSGITTVRMAKYVSDIIESLPQLSGLYQVSSVPISKFDLLQIFNKAFDINADIIKDCSYKSKKDLISDRFFNDTKFSKPNWEDLISELKQDYFQNIKFYQ